MLTKAMSRVLDTLRNAKAQNTPFIPIVADKRTIQVLHKRDLIIVSAGHDGTRYTITGRGISELEAYEGKEKRNYALCAKCKENPRRRYTTGKLGTYCKECDAERQRLSRKAGITANAKRACSMCHKKKRRVYPSGIVSTYCRECGLIQRNSWRWQKEKQIKERVNNGELLLCVKCGEYPRRQSASRVYDYCEACYKAWVGRQIANSRKRIFRKLVNH